ncbi:DNA-binding protein [Ruminococcaceae bacterium BL-6]|nr:DNA-binding protein [Ruminococcaceae bacterium BL-6]
MLNLKAEMVRHSITVPDIQKAIGCSEKTVRNKIEERTEFTLTEAFRIRELFFRDCPFEYLFKPDKKKSA